MLICMQMILLFTPQHLQPVSEIQFQMKSCHLRLVIGKKKQTDFDYVRLIEL